MWYFIWALGILMASSLCVLNALWLENNEDLDRPSDLNN